MAKISMDDLFNFHRAFVHFRHFVYVGYRDRISRSVVADISAYLNQPSRMAQQGGFRFGCIGRRQSTSAPMFQFD